MSRIRNKDTAPEKALRSALWKAGLRFTLWLGLPGKPDVCFTRARLAVFVDGCFWHGCPVHGTRPKSNQIYWKAKIEGNRFRDLAVLDKLESVGWHGVRLWEHELAEDMETVVERIKAEWQARIAVVGARSASIRAP